MHGIQWDYSFLRSPHGKVYKLGAQNGNADALSRINAMVTRVCSSGRLDEKKKAEILREYNDSVLRGHRGMNRTYEAIKDNYSWENMRKKIEENVKKYENCETNKLLRPRKRVPGGNHQHREETVREMCTRYCGTTSGKLV
jgi:hypothetical protein